MQGNDRRIKTTGTVSVSKRVVVIVPIGADTIGDSNRSARSDNRIVASFAVTNSGSGLVVERPGAPAKVAHAAEDDALVVGFAAACARARRTVPSGLRVRVGSRGSGEHTRDTLVAATIAGVASANALLTLGIDDAGLAEVAAKVVGTEVGRIRAGLRDCGIVVHHDCDDTPASVPDQTSNTR